MAVSGLFGGLGPLGRGNAQSRATLSGNSRGAWRRQKQVARDSIAACSQLDASRESDKAPHIGAEARDAAREEQGEQQLGEVFSFGDRQGAASPSATASKPTSDAPASQAAAEVVQQSPTNGADSGIESDDSSDERDSNAELNSILRKLTSQDSADDILEVLPELATSTLPVEKLLHPDTCCSLFDACLAKGKLDLALGIYRAMAQDSTGWGMVGSDDSSAQPGPQRVALGPTWPPADTRVVQHVVRSLVESLRVQDAINVIQGLQFRGLPNSAEVPFGSTVYCPFPPFEPLCVMQPQTAVQQVRDASTRYIYDLTAGKVSSVTSQEMAPNSNPLVRALQSTLKRTPPSAVHEILLQCPDGQARTFRCGTPTNEVPCQEGERITVVSVPTTPLKGQGSMLPPSPPNTVPGQALSVTNHQTGLNKPLVRPPVDQQQQGIPGWVGPLAIILAGSDAAVGMIDPALPLVGIGALSVVVGNAVLMDQVVIPRLKQLPVEKVAKESVQQGLLARHDRLVQKLQELVEEASTDVRLLARLWQLTRKMQVLGGSGEELYAARLERVDAARANLDEKVTQQLELIEQFARVVNMIEVEVELDMQVPEAEVANIEEQIAKLYEVEELQREWQAQV